MELWQLLAHQHWFSFRVFGFELRLCSRCSGYIAGFLFFIAFRTRIIDFQVIQEFSVQHQLVFYLLFAIPLILDWLSQSWGLRKSNNVTRFTTGVILGMGVSLFSVSRFLPDLKTLLFTLIAFTVLIIGLIGNKNKRHRILETIF